MTNDTNTLNGALQELGELMADNLVTMGVTDADASDGLTTLANRILDIQGGGGSTVASITLSASEPIIESGDTSVLTVTAYDSSSQGVSEASINLYQGATKIATLRTDSTGSKTYTYTGTGVGDVTFYATDGTVSSSNVTVEDCYYYDTTELSYTSSSITVSSAITSLFDINDHNFIMEFDIKSTGTGGGLNVGATSEYTPPSSANYRIYIGTDTSKFNINNRTTSSNSSSTGAVTDGTYYHMKLVKNGTTFTGYYGDNNTTIASKTASWISDYNSWDLYWINWTNTNYVKNIKIKFV